MVEAARIRVANQTPSSSVVWSNLDRQIHTCAASALLAVSLAALALSAGVSRPSAQIDEPVNAATMTVPPITWRLTLTRSRLEVNV